MAGLQIDSLICFRWASLQRRECKRQVVGAVAKSRARGRRATMRRAVRLFHCPADRTRGAFWPVRRSVSTSRLDYHCCSKLSPADKHSELEPGSCIKERGRFLCAISRRLRLFSPNSRLMSERDKPRAHSNRCTEMNLCLATGQNWPREPADDADHDNAQRDA